MTVRVTRGMTVEQFRKATAQFYDGPEHNDYRTEELFLSLALEMLTSSQRIHLIKKYEQSLKQGHSNT